MKKKIEKTKRDQQTVVLELQSLRLEFEEMKKNLGKFDQTDRMDAFDKRLVKLEKLILAKVR